MYFHCARPLDIQHHVQIKREIGNIKSRRVLMLFVKETYIVVIVKLFFLNRLTNLQNGRLHCSFRRFD